MRSFSLVSRSTEEAPDPERIVAVVPDCSTSAVLEGSLRQAGLPCRILSSAEEALELLRTTPCACVLCDLRTGQAAELLASMRIEHPEVALVVVASDVREGMLATVAGADGYLLEPLDPTAVAEQARWAVSKRRLSQPRGATDRSRGPDW